MKLFSELGDGRVIVYGSKATKSGMLRKLPKIIHERGKNNGDN
jgi:hypothetical protein